MPREVTFAALQFSCTWDIEDNLVSGRGYRRVVWGRGRAGRAITQVPHAR